MAVEGRCGRRRGNREESREYIYIFSYFNFQLFLITFSFLIFLSVSSITDDENIHSYDIYLQLSDYEYRKLFFVLICT